MVVVHFGESGWFGRFDTSFTEKALVCSEFMRAKHRVPKTQRLILIDKMNGQGF